MANQPSDYNTNGQTMGTGKPENMSGGPSYFGGPQKSGPSYTVDNDYKNDEGFQNRNSYGGKVGGADENVNRYRGMGSSADQRQAYQANYGDYQGNAWNAQQARGVQGQALDLQRSAALGQQPSQAQIMGQQMTQNALSNQVAAAGSARGGPMQQAAAMNNAAAGASQYTQQATNAQMAQRAAEMAQARGAYMQGATDVRGQDYTGAGLGLQKSAQELQNEQFQRGLNQQGQEYYEGLANDVNKTQLAANENAQASANQQFASNQGIRQGDESLNWDKVKTIGGAAIGAATGGAGAALGSGLGSGAAARGGHVEHDRPYLVGEKGPELVVPKEDGWVMTAQQTAALLGAPPTGQQLAHMPAPEHRMFGGSMTGANPLAGYKAGELGMGGPGGLVGGTIGHENSDVAGAFKPMGGLGGYREEGGPVKAKSDLYSGGVPSGAWPLAEGRGGQLHVDEKGHAYASAAPDVTSGASISGAAPRYSTAERAAVPAPVAAARRAERKMTPEEMSAEADRMIAATNAQKEAQLARGPAVEGGFRLPPPWLVQYMQPPAREEGGAISSAANHVARFVHHIASSAADATAPEPIAVERKTPNAAESRGAKSIAYTGTGYQGSEPQPTTSTMTHSGPKEYAEKVTRAHSDDEKAKACGGPIRGTREEGGAVDKFMSPEEREAAGDPYKREPQRGVAGAPKGYAADRAGQPGAYENTPSVAHGYEPQGDTRAPGSADWDRYGAPGKGQGDPNWGQGGTTMPVGGPGGGGGWLARFLSGFSTGMRPYAAPQAKGKST